MHFFQEALECRPTYIANHEHRLYFTNNSGRSLVQYINLMFSLSACGKFYHGNRDFFCSRKGQNQIEKLELAFRNF